MKPLENDYTKNTASNDTSRAHLDDLNPAQKEAVLHTNGPLIIVAGAGTGKTRVLTRRILHLIKQGVAPESILAITFTNKAAGEMRERVSKLLRSEVYKSETFQLSNFPTSRQPFIGTFHSFGVMLLRENAEALGIPSRFTIFDRDDSLALIKRVQKDMGIDSKTMSPSSVLSAISRNKNEGTTLDTYRAKRNDYTGRTIASIWEHYTAGLQKERAFDFDDLIVTAYEMLTRHPEILERYRARFSHILIDEYQDTNVTQYELAQLIAQPKNNICVVGDHDQCIYTWRSADLRNLARFEEAFEDTRIILLEENYRSTKTILTAANDIIKQNAARKDKTLFTNNNDGELLELFVGGNETHEARWVAHRAKELIESGVPSSEIAVLFRAHFQSRALEEAFLAENVSYQMVGTRFFERKEVKDVMSYIGAALNPSSTTNFVRIVNVPARGIGKVSVARILAGQEHELSASHQAKLAQFREILTRIREASTHLAPSEFVMFVLKESGIEAELASEGDDGVERILNVKELASLASRYDNYPPDDRLNMFLDAVSLASDQDSMEKSERSIKLMTIHAAKGLEFDHVFITGLEEGLFPSERSEGRATPEEREEERRLFYVAITRAKKQAHLSYAAVRTVFGSTNINIPSRFITEIDDALIAPSEMSAPFGKAHTSQTGGRGELLTIDWDEM